jgi:dUTP pyrophosphatase
LYSVDTGISVQPPPGFYCEVVPRSSIVKTDFVLANSVGVIDPGYRGRILVLLRYLGPGTGDAEARSLLGQRVAQLLLRRLNAVRIEAVQELEATTRGAGGFGSTGS